MTPTATRGVVAGEPYLIKPTTDVVSTPHFDGVVPIKPTYNWEAMKADGYGWWIRRIDGIKKLYDVIRIDHFRGFESYCAVPYGDANARRGVWKKGPGMDLIGMLRSWFHGLEFIAEDLGYTTPEVEKLLSDSGFPGMKILEFGFDADGDAPYMPHNCKENSVCYIGTHDNEGGGLVLGHDPHRHGHRLEALRHADAGYP